jgi:glycosidase
VVYYGDEQGFAGLGGDQESRQSMFASKVEAYNKVPLVGTSRTTAVDNFSPDHPIYRAIAELAAIRKADPAFSRGEQVVRAAGTEAGLFAFSRKLGARETLVVLNTSTKPITAQVKVDYASNAWRSVRGQCQAAASAPGSYRVTVAPLDYLICRAAGP